MAAEWRITWLDEARDDLYEIVGFFAQDNLTIAGQIFERIVAKVDTLAGLANRGRIVPETSSGHEPRLQELVESPWRIMYAVEGGEVVVAAIVDGRRDVEAFLDQRFGPQRPPDD